jgi:S-adenosyl-L-methionine hydrolase (adenosine-forming)
MEKEVEYTSGIITLITDLGVRDHYLGQLKGSLLSNWSDLKIVDISNHVAKFNIQQASFILSNTWKKFPVGTIHACIVNPSYDKNPKFLCVKKDGHFFIAPDNGLLSIAFNGMPEEVVLIEEYNNKYFLAPVAINYAIAIIKHKNFFENTSSFYSNPKISIPIKPGFTDSVINGSVIYINEFGNAIFNISKSFFLEISKGRNQTFLFKRFDPIQNISIGFDMSQIGEISVLFNGDELLEMGINFGNLAKMYDVEIGDNIMIQFKNL